MQKIRRRWKRILVIGLILLTIVFGYQRFKAGSVKKAITYTVKRQDLRDVLSLSGHIDATEKVDLQFQTAGLISWVGVKEGDWVNKYQTLASLDQQALKKQLQKDLNLYIENRNIFDQNLDNNKGQVISDSLKRIGNNYQQDLNNSVLDVELQDLSLKYSNLWTPIGGLVTRVDRPVAGVNISSPTQAVVQVVNFDTLYFSSVADQTDVTKLNGGMGGELVLDSYPDIKIPVIINEVSFTPKTGESGTVYEVKNKLNNPQVSYRLGMTGDASFVLKEKRNILALPKNLVKDNHGQKFVYQYLQAKGVRKNVTIGETIDNQTEITSGLSEKDVIVDKP